MLILKMISWIPNYLSSLPLHSQLAKTIRQKINSHILRYGHILPTATEIGVQLGVPAHIVRSAYAELQQDNLGNLQANGTFMIGSKRPFISHAGKQLNEGTTHY